MPPRNQKRPRAERPKRQNEPIAIIGVGCRFPGADSLNSFWEVLKNGTDAVAEILPDRFDVNAYYDSRAGTPGKIISRRGGFLKDIDRFDASFFNISPREAERTDPQQRLLLETSWEAFEDAGIPAERLEATRTGVFIGMWSNEYQDRMINATTDIDLFVTTGAGRYSASGRLSYTFDLRGPSLTIDTACSSSLVAIHLACRSLRSGESTLALAGGANLILEPYISVGYSRSRMLSPDGRCKFGDASADGYVRSEGVGIILLKPLSRALADGDPIHALIRGSAVNNDGHSGGLLVAPSVKGQQEMLLAAYKDAGISPSEVHYVEAHGTGTPVGDPIELSALGAVLSKGRKKEQFCQLGSVKTNIGHTEAASGIAGLIKTVLILKHRMVPANLHFREPNPKIPWGELPFVMQRELGSLNVASGPALAGVNSFGITGTNAHIVLQEAPFRREEQPKAAKEQKSKAPAHNGQKGQQTQSVLLLPLSAHSPEGLKAKAKDMKRLLDSEQSQVEFAAICHTAGLNRTHHEYRLAVVGSTRLEMGEQLEAFPRDEDRKGLSSGRANPELRHKLAFVFCGQGPQWWAMGRELLEQEPIFREMMERCDALLRKHASWSLTAELAAEESSTRLHQTEIAQPALFALQVSLVALWRSWGIQPDAVVGHSVGEVAAAHVAGALRIEDAMRVVFHRGRLMQQATGGGQMAEVGLTAAETQSLLSPYGPHLSVAAVNSPTVTVVSGETTAVEDILRHLQQRGIGYRRLPVNYAFHSHQMAAFQSELSRELEDLRPQPNALPMVSTVTGSLIRGEDLVAAYWGRNVREPVFFAKAIENLAEQGCDFFMEIGPHPVLTGHIEDTLQGRHGKTATLTSLSRKRPERATLLASLGTLYANGFAVDWKGLYPTHGRPVPLPSYPWQRQRFWLEPSGTATATIHKQQQASETGADQNKWLFELQWTPAPSRINGGVSREPETWLIFADKSGVGDHFRNALLAKGHRVILVSAGDSYAQMGSDSFQIKVGCKEDMSRLLVAATGTKQDRCQHVVHLWSLDAAPASEIDTSSLELALELGCITALHLIQAVAESQWEKKPRVSLITAGAQSVNGTVASSSGLAQSPLWGIGRVFGEEHPDMWGGLVDLDPEELANQSAACLANELVDGAGDFTAFRRGSKYVAKLIRHGQSGETRSLPKILFRRDCSYLVTGGLGGVGLQVCRWLAERGARRLVVIGRTPLPPRSGWSSLGIDDPATTRTKAVRTLESLGADVRYVAIDVADEKQLATFLLDYEVEGRPPIRGVIHAAGVIEDSLLLNTDASSLQRVLRSKVLGGWLLHSSLPELDFFVLFSSIGSLIGIPGQGSYAAANSFLDALAQYRFGLGKPGISINWPIWSGDGFGAKIGGQYAKQYLEQEGIEGITPMQGLNILADLIEQPSPHVGVIPISGHQTNSRPPTITERLSSRIVAQIATEDPACRPGNPEPIAKFDPIPSLRDELLAVKSEERLSFLVAYLQNELAHVLNMVPTQVDPLRAMNALGLTSLLALELSDRLEAGLGLRLSATLTFNYPTIARLAPYLAEKMGVTLEQSLKRTTETIGLPVARAQQWPGEAQSDYILDVEQMTDAEVLKTFNRKR